MRILPFFFLLSLLLPLNDVRLYLYTCIQIMHHFPYTGKKSLKEYWQTPYVTHYLHPVLTKDRSYKHAQDNHFD